MGKRKLSILFLLSRSIYFFAMIFGMIQNLCAKSITHSELMTLLSSKLTHIDFNGDGRVDVIRKFKKGGHDLEKIIYYEYGQTISKEIVDFSKHPLQILRQKIIGRRLIEHSLEEFSHNGHVLAKRTIIKLETKTIEDYSGQRITISHYKKNKNQWMLIKTEKMASLLLKRRRTFADRKKGKQSKEELADSYISCLKDKLPENNSDSCFDLARLNPITEFASLAKNIVQLTCDNGDEIFTPYGFRIDKSSCGETASKEVKVLQKAAREVTENRMKCLMDLNPEFGKDCADAYLEKRPKLICAKGLANKNGGGVEGFLDKYCEGNGKCDRKGLKNIYNSTDGFYDGAKPNDLYITGLDPTASDGIKSTDHQSYDKLVSVLFHEMLHSCGHSGGKKHNHPHLDDDVYGCEALCGGDSSNITFEGCQKCLTSSGNRKNSGRKNKNFCKQFPKEQVLRSVKDAFNLGTTLRDCVLNRVECKGNLTILLSRPEYQNFCKQGIETEEHKKSCFSQLTKFLGQLIHRAGGEAGGEELFKAMEIYATAKDGSFSVTRNNEGKLLVSNIQIGSERSKRNKTTKVATLILMMSNQAFCQEMKSIKSPLAYARLRTSYEDSISIEVPKINRVLPPVHGSTKLEYDKAQKACDYFGGESGWRLLDGIQHRGQAH